MSRSLVLIALCCLLGRTAPSEGNELLVSPARVEFQDAFARSQLLVERDGADGTTVAKFSSSNERVVSVDSAGLLTPWGVGHAEVTIKLGDQSAVVPVEVTKFIRDRQIDFATEIEPLLTRHGCNSGGCHGKASGQNGFKLSLFGFDAEGDHAALVREARGRRVSTSAPDHSLLLLKSIGKLPHGGGRRIEPGSEAYSVLRAWIASGATASAPDVPRVQKIVVEPADRVFATAGREGPGMDPARQQLRVMATYTDGSTRDVTRQADYASNLDVVATVDKQGLVTLAQQTGEATVMARFMGQVAVFRAIRPHGEPLQEIADFSPLNEIDRLAVDKWKKLGLQPSPVSDDATFLRRATLDLCGRLPTVDETRQFLSDSSDQKRAQLIDRLLASPDYPAYFALKWSAILRNSQLAGSTNAAYAFHNWIKDDIAQNRPYDQFVRGIVAAAGEWQDAPAINWYWQSRDDQLHTVTADTAQLFLGVRLQCARCHHHPYERWGQDDYFGLAGFFTRLGRKSFGEPPPYFASSNVTTGELNPLTGRSPEPKLLDGEVQKFSSEQDPRHALVDWMARPENPYFARALVNRTWGHFFGIGLVNEIDDMRETNPPSNPAILDYLSKEFVQSGFDRKHIIKLIVGSRLYQLSSEPRPENERDRQNFARFYARRLIAEVLLDAVDQTCGTRTNFGNMSATSRAVDLPHEGFGSYFMDTFDRPQRVTVCECERSPGATLAQVLLLGNSDEVESKLADGYGRIARLLKEQQTPVQIIEELYLAAYSRNPTAAELRTTTEFVERETNKQRALEDILWTLLNSREFTFNR